MVKNLTFVLRIFFAYALLSIGCFLMLRTIVGYTVFRDDVQFLVLKQAYVHNVAWKTVFYVHVFSAVVALLAGFTQFSRELLRDNPRVHRLIGKIYVVDILFINFPAGMIMGVCANGGLPGKMAFLLLDILWFFFTWKAYVCARNRRFIDHKNYMIRSFALTFAAVTLRTWKLILSSILTVDLAQLYVIDAWLAFVPNLVVAEIIIRKNKVLKSPG